MTSTTTRHRPSTRAWSVVLVTLLLGIGMLWLPTAGPQPAVAAVEGCTPTAANNNCFRYTFAGGNQTFVVPKGATSLVATLWGGAGGSATIGSWSGGAAGYTLGTVAVEPGATLDVTVGGGGANNAGGLSAYGGGGAVATGVESQFGSAGGGGLSGLWAGSPFSADTALLIAGGGGGGAANRAGGALTAPGGGGGAVGGSGGGATGGAGTQTAGGAALGGNGCPIAATAGSQFQGGDGAAAGRPPGDGFGGESGAGGGGGWFGGGGGRCRPNREAAPPGGGGGGSGYIGGAGVSGATTLGGDNSNGQSGLGRIPYGTENPQYVSGVGASVLGANGGNGLVVLELFLPQTVITAPAAGSRTTDPTPAVVGRGSAGTTLTLTDTTTGDIVCSTTVADDGSWTCTPGAALAYGDHTFQATEQDPAVPTAVYPTSAATSIVIFPAAVVIDAPTDGSSTFEPRPPINGSGAVPGATVTVEVGGQTLTTTADDDGEWSVTPTTDLAPGDYTVSARQTADDVDSDVTEVDVTIEDLPAPTITTPREGFRTTDRRPALAGRAEPGATVRLSLAGRTVSVRASSGGAWRTAIGLPLGVYRVTATQTVGSVTSEASAGRRFTVYRPVPAAPAEQSDQDESDTSPGSAGNDNSSGSSGNDDESNSTAPDAAPQSPGNDDSGNDDSGNDDSSEAPDPDRPDPDSPKAGAPAEQANPNDYLPVSLNVAARTLTPGEVASYVGTLGPNEGSSPITVTLSGTVNRGVLYRSVSSDPAGDCIVSTIQFSCTITLLPGQRATLQLRVLADALNAPQYARQQITVSTGGARPNTSTYTTRINIKPTEVSQLAAAISSGPSAFLILLVLYMYALAATEWERHHPRTDDPAGS